MHRLHPGHPLVLAGVNIPYEKGFAVYSDGDVVSHALVDAITGALAEGDIADHFSDKDPQNRGIQSIRYLARLHPLLEKHCAHIVNIDCVIEAEQPKLKPFFPEMRRTLGNILRIPVDRVSIKGKTTEGMGYLGQSQAVAARAIALVSLEDREERPAIK